VTPIHRLLDDAARGVLPNAEAALRLGAPDGLSTAALTEAARARRERSTGRVVTFSPKVFLPLTNLCRNFCDYCSFRRSPGDPGAWTMTPGRGQRAPGVRPRRRLCGGAVLPGRHAGVGVRRLPRHPGESRPVLDRGLPGLGGRARAGATGYCRTPTPASSTREAMQRLRARQRQSLGLMLENVQPATACAPRACRTTSAPDKRPATSGWRMHDAKRGELLHPLHQSGSCSSASARPLRRAHRDAAWPSADLDARARPHPGGHHPELPRAADDHADGRLGGAGAGPR
jgi:hypothetical protein